MNVEQIKAGNGHAADAALEAALDEAIEAVSEVETTFVTMLVSMGDSVQALLADLHRLEDMRDADLRRLDERYVKERTAIEAKLTKIAKALGAK